MINPLNDRLAPQELVYILNDPGSSVLFVDAAFAPVVVEIRDQLPRMQTVVLIGAAMSPTTRATTT